MSAHFRVSKGNEIRSAMLKIADAPPISDIGKARLMPEGTEEPSSHKRKAPLEAGAKTKKPRSEAAREASYDIHSISGPHRPIPCKLQIGDGPIIGSLSQSNAGLCPELSLDAGWFGAPSIGLIFVYPGTDMARQADLVGNICWRVDGHVGGEWGIQKLATGYIPSHDRSDLKIYNPDVVGSLTKSALYNFYFIALTVVPYLSGYDRIKASIEKSSDGQNNSLEAHLHSLRPVYHGDENCEVRIWFYGPKDLRNFSKRCLAVIEQVFNQREPPLGQARDVNGKCILQLSRGPTPPSLANESKMREPTAK